MKRLLKTLCLTVPLLMWGLYYLVKIDAPITFESEESKTLDNNPVFNRIHFIPGSDKDVWMMQQSHLGLSSPHQKWDRLAIIVTKTPSLRAQFMQLEPGTMEWREDLPRKEFRVSCFVCHPNGPRAIRPNFDSENIRLALLDRLRIALLNLRIKSYGRVLYDTVHDEEDKVATIPFRHRSHFENEKLKVLTCTKCHSENGTLARGELTRQNAITIAFMVSTAHMPPLWFSLAETEREAIRKFIEGF